jgi:hypothetical protein
MEERGLDFVYWRWIPMPERRYHLSRTCSRILSISISYIQRSSRPAVGPPHSLNTLLTAQESSRNSFAAFPRTKASRSSPFSRPSSSISFTKFMPVSVVENG